MKSNKSYTTITGASGEYYVLSQLLRRGWIAALAPDGAPNMDILVTNVESEKVCAIQVKTARLITSKNGWHMSHKHETIISDKLFYAFVDIGEEVSAPIVSYILPSQVVADCIRSCHEVWMDTPGRGGQPHKEVEMRMLFPDHAFIKPITDQGKTIIDQYRDGWLEPYRENWGILGLPAVR